MARQKKIRVGQKGDRPRAGSLEDMIIMSGQGRQFFIDMLLQACHDGVPEALRFMTEWDKLNELEQDNIDIDHFAQLTGANIRALKGLFIEETARYKQGRAAFRAALSLEEIVDTAVDQAKTPKGLEDRKLILRNQRFIESDRPMVNIDQSQHLELSGDATRRFEEILNRSHNQLTSKKPKELPEADFIDAEEVPDDTNSV